MVGGQGSRVTRGGDAAFPSIRTEGGNSYEFHSEALGTPKVTINDRLCYAICRILSKPRDLNAHFLGDKVVKHGAVHLGVAVDTPRCLMVPVVRNAHGMAMRELSSSVRSLADQCQKGSTRPDHLSGGTFTIASVGGISLKPVKREVFPSPGDFLRQSQPVFKRRAVGGLGLFEPFDLLGGMAVAHRRVVAGVGEDLGAVDGWRG